MSDVPARTHLRESPPKKYQPIQTMKALVALALFLPAVAAFGTVVTPVSVTGTIAGDARSSVDYLLIDNAGFAPDSLQDVDGNEVLLDTGDPLTKALATYGYRAGNGQNESWTRGTNQGEPVFTFDLTGSGDTDIGSVLLWQYGNNGGTGPNNGGNSTKDFALIFHTDAEGDVFDFDTETIDFTGTMEVITGDNTIDNIAQVFYFGATETVRYVGLKIVSNYGGAYGGGDRYGLGEVRFATEIDSPEMIGLPDTITVDSDGSDVTFDVEVENMGVVTTLTVTGASVTGLDASLFTVDTALPFDVAPGEKSTIQITMKTAGHSGAVEADLEVASNDTVNPTKTVPITGIVADPEIEAPAGIVVESGGGVVTVDVVIANIGASNPLTLSPDPVVGGTDAASFTVKSFPASIAAGATGTIVLEYDPDGYLGPIEAELYVDSDAALNPSITVPITGSSSDPFIKVADQSFGPFANGSPVQTLALPVENIGDTADLEIADGDVAITDDPLGVFALATDFTDPLTVGPGATGTLEFTFDPTGLGGGIYTATVEIYSNDIDHLPVSVQFVVDLQTPGNQLIAWWPLDNGAQDASGNGHDGDVVNLSGSVAFGAPGAIAGSNTAASFTPNARITVPADEELNPSSFTFVAWARPLTGSTGYRSVVTSRSDDWSANKKTYGYIIYKASNNQWEFWSGSGGVEATSWQQTRQLAGDVNFDQWVHLAITYDHTTQTKTLFENGVEVASDTGVALARNLVADLHIGAGSDTGGQYFFDGDIDDVALFNYVLPQTDIETIYTDGVSSFTGIVPPQNPYLGWAAGFPGFTDTAPGVDFEGDGLDNALEYVLAGDPTSMDVGEVAPSGDVDANDLAFVFRRADAAATDPNTEILVQYGSDLVGWTPAEDGVDGVAITVDDDFYGAGIDRVTALIPRTLAADARMFARLQVTVAEP